MALIGVALLVIAALMIYVGLSQPKISADSEQTVSQTTQETTAGTKESDSISYDAVVEYPLDINTATLDELMTIDGLGEVRASAIIEYREVLGGYTSVSQIMDIKGFGEGYYEQIAPYLTVK